MNDHWRQGKLKPENARVLSQVARLTMSETVFWGALRFRIIRSGQLAALGYCDWLEVKRYCIGPPDARIEGLVGLSVAVPPAKRTSLFWYCRSRWNLLMRLTGKASFRTQKGLDG
jgi:hypothetical protein